MKSIADMFELAHRSAHKGGERVFPDVWYEDNVMQVYARIGPVADYSTKSIIPCFTIANVLVDEDLRGKGIFKEFLRKVELLPVFNIAVENIHNKRLDSFLERRGYVPFNVQNDIVNFIHSRILYK